MRIKIIYQIECNVEGEDIAQCRDKFESGENWEHDDIEIVSVRNVDTGKDLMEEWDHAYDEESDDDYAREYFEQMREDEMIEARLNAGCQKPN